MPRMMRALAFLSLTLAILVIVPIRGAQLTFGPGDVFVSLEPGPIQWRLPDGTLRAVLIPTVLGFGEGMAFDQGGDLYIARWRSDGMGLTGNTIERFNNLGLSMGKVGSGYNCDPHTIAFNSSGHRYVGQAACNRSILKFSPSWTRTAEYMVAQDAQGVFWMELAPDNCTMFYTSYAENVKRYDVCTGTQLPDFNAAPLPGGTSQDLRILADGGVLVSSGPVIARLDANGAVSQTYEVPGDSALWAGLDLVGDGSFWAANYFSSNVYRLDLATGAVIDQFNTGTQPNTAVAVRVFK